MADRNRITIISEIVDRAWDCGMNKYCKDKLSLMMDIDAADRDCPLKLQELLDADFDNFCHDVIGIRENLNRETKKLENCFLPRYAK